MNFFEQVYRVVRRIPPGKVATYGQVAKVLGSRDARLVGFALHANPEAGEIPCHRVVSRLGGLAGGFAFGGEKVQHELLENEGVKFDRKGKVNLKISGLAEADLTRLMSEGE